jgi:hypothetical protein
VVRASSTIISNPPRLLHAENFLAISSHPHNISNHYLQTRAFASVCLPVRPRPLPQLRASFLGFSPIRCGLTHSSFVPVVALMSSRLAPAYSSFRGLTHFESKGVPELKCRAPASVQPAVEIRPTWVSRERFVKVGRVRVSSSRCMENEKSGQRVECYNASSSQSPAGGDDQPLSSTSVLPPTLPPESKVRTPTTWTNFLLWVLAHAWLKE